MSLHDKQWRPVCSVEDLVENSGVCVLVNEDTDREQQVALFNIGGDQVFAVSNFDPFGKANVLYRGIIGSIQERYVVASPLYKQHFDLQNGKCIEDDSVALSTFEVRFENNNVELFC